MNLLFSEHENLNASNELTSQLFTILDYSISPGCLHLESIARLVINNRQWLLSQLDVPPAMAHSKSTPQPTKAEFKVDISEPVTEKVFNPIEAMMSIGNTVFDQVRK